MIAAGDIFIATTIFLESEWVLRSAYGFSAKEIAIALRRMAGLPGVKVEEAVRLAHALDWTEAGMDLADALHLAKADACIAFLTFDNQLIKIAKGRSSIPVGSP